MQRAQTWHTDKLQIHWQGGRGGEQELESPCQAGSIADGITRTYQARVTAPKMMIMKVGVDIKRMAVTVRRGQNGKMTRRIVPNMTGETSNIINIIKMEGSLAREPCGESWNLRLHSRQLTTRMKRDTAKGKRILQSTNNLDTQT